MYKITVHYKSNIPGVYTKEEEIATDEHNLQFKKERILTRWLEKLCPHINLNSFMSNSDIFEYKFKELQFKAITYIIDNHLDLLDVIDEEKTGFDTTLETQRKFEIIVEKI